MLCLQIDMDTIDVSNLNRQFLFRKEHVGKPKSEVAKDSILQHYPDVSIKAHFRSIIEYEIIFFVSCIVHRSCNSNTFTS